MTTFESVTTATFPTPFKIAFKHSSAARSATENVIVIAKTTDGDVGYGEGTPRSYVTGETTASAIAFLHQIIPELTNDVSNIDDLESWISNNATRIDDNPAAFCAVELALLDALAKDAKVSVDALLGLPELSGAFTYSAVLGDNPIPVFAAQAARYRWSRLTDFKVKLSGDLARDRWKTRILKRTGPLRLRVDANNHWADPGRCIDFLRGLETPLFGIEEPLQADDHDGFLEVATALDAPVILDESLLRTQQLTDLPGEPQHWTLNCRLSKMGGLIRSLKVAADAVAHGSGLVIGAHVGETSLLTRAALSVANVNRHALLAQEGAFGTHLLKADVTDNPLMFGRHGTLHAAGVGHDRPQAGLGVNVIASRLR